VPTLALLRSPGFEFVLRHVLCTLVPVGEEAEAAAGSTGDAGDPEGNILNNTSAAAGNTTIGHGGMTLVDQLNSTLGGGGNGGGGAGLSPSSSSSRGPSIEALALRTWLLEALAVELHLGATRHAADLAQRRDDAELVSALLGPADDAIIERRDRGGGFGGGSSGAEVEDADAELDDIEADARTSVAEVLALGETRLAALLAWLPGAATYSRRGPSFDPRVAPIAATCTFIASADDGAKNGAAVADRFYSTSSSSFAAGGNGTVNGTVNGNGNGTGNGNGDGFGDSSFAGGVRDGIVGGSASDPVSAPYTAYHIPTLHERLRDEFPTRDVIHALAVAVHHNDNSARAAAAARCLAAWSRLACLASMAAGAGPSPSAGPSIGPVPLWGLVRDLVGRLASSETASALPAATSAQAECLTVLMRQLRAWYLVHGAEDDAVVDVGGGVGGSNQTTSNNNNNLSNHNSNHNNHNNNHGSSYFNGTAADNGGANGQGRVLYIGGHMAPLCHGILAALLASLPRLGPLRAARGHLYVALHEYLRLTEGRVAIVGGGRVGDGAAADHRDSRFGGAGPGVGDGAGAGDSRAGEFNLTGGYGSAARGGRGRNSTVAAVGLAPLALGNRELLAQHSDALLTALTRDAASRVGDAWPSVAVALLGEIVADHGGWIDGIEASGALGRIVGEWTGTEGGCAAGVMAVLSGAPAPSLQALFAYEAMASLLTRVAATERGATLLVDRGVLASIARSTLLARAAEIDAAILDNGLGGGGGGGGGGHGNGQDKAHDSAAAAGHLPGGGGGGGGSDWLPSLAERSDDVTVPLLRLCCAIAASLPESARVASQLGAVLSSRRRFFSRALRGAAHGAVTVARASRISLSLELVRHVFTAPDAAEFLEPPVATKYATLCGTVAAAYARRGNWAPRIALVGSGGSSGDPTGLVAAGLGAGGDGGGGDDGDLAFGIDDGGGAGALTTAAGAKLAASSTELYEIEALVATSLGNALAVLAELASPSNPGALPELVFAPAFGTSARAGSLARSGAALPLGVLSDTIAGCVDALDPASAAAATGAGRAPVNETTKNASVAMLLLWVHLGRYLATDGPDGVSAIDTSGLSTSFGAFGNSSFGILDNNSFTNNNNNTNNNSTAGGLSRSAASELRREAETRLREPLTRFAAMAAAQDIGEDTALIQVLSRRLIALVTE
jgi:hypothetical protein